MKQFVFIGVCLCLFTATGYAEETLYIDDLRSMTLGLRDEPGLSKKYRETIEAGPVEVIKTEKYAEKDWSYVRLQNGKEGWILNDFIKSKKPISLEYKELKESRKKYDKFSEQMSALNEEIKKLKAENEKLASDSVEKLKKIKELSNSYSVLKTEAAEAQKIKPSEPVSSPKIEAKSEPKDEFKSEPKVGIGEAFQNIGMSEFIKGALIGVGILLVGYLMGAISGGGKRKSSYF